MSIAGLRKESTFEEVLALATRDEQRQPGDISIGLQNGATRIINSPDFQRVQDTLTEDLETQQRHHVEQQTFTNNIQNLALEARVNRNDLQYIVQNLQQPPAPPPPPPPSTNFAADRERLAAELNGVAMQRQQAEQAAALAQRTLAQLLQQRQESPAQRIVNNFTQSTQFQPTFVQHNTMQHHFQNFQQFFNHGGRAPGDIDIQMVGPRGQQFGRSAPALTRPGPYSTAIVPAAAAAPAARPAAPSSASIPAPPAHYTPEQRMDYYLAHHQGRRPPKVPKPRRQSTAPAAASSASSSALALPPMGAADLRVNATRRMQEMGHQRMQQGRRDQMAQRALDTDRALRRGGAPGDVVGTGKRKLMQGGMPEFNPRRRVNDRVERFSLTY